MNRRLRVAPIVEGHGEYAAVPILLRRIWYEMLAGEFIDVIRPIRIPRSKLLRTRAVGDEPALQEAEVQRAADLAARKLRIGGSADPTLTLILLDADADCPARLAPALLRAAGPGPVACVLAKVEYETWLVASARSLGDYLNVRDEDVPVAPEANRCGKAWIESRIKRGKYSETVDQARMTHHLDLQVCRASSPSFDKLCRVLEARRDGPGPG